MRFSDGLERYPKSIKSNFRHNPEKEGYGDGLRLLQSFTKISDWRLLIDVQQISTRAAGKSCCAWFVHVFKSLDDAIAVVRLIQTELKSVNTELQICPDGLLDRGDGPAGYERHEGPHYIPENGFCAVLLVDAQNLTRITTYDVLV